MHPEEKRLIFFPVIGISWMLDDMINALKGFNQSRIRKEVKEILKENGLIGNDNEPTSLGAQLLTLLDNIRKFPEPSAEDPKFKFKKDEHAHAPKGYQKFAMTLAYIPFVEQIIGVKFKNSAETRVISSDSDGTLYCQYSDGDKAYEIKVVTTAKTKGEAEMVKKYMEDIIQKG